MRTEVYENMTDAADYLNLIKGAMRFIQEMKKAEVAKVFYKVSELKPSDAGDTTDQPAKKKAIFSSVMVMSCHVRAATVEGDEPNDSQYLMEGRYVLTSPPIVLGQQTTMVDYEAFKKFAESTFEEIRMKLKDEHPNCDLFPGFVTQG